MTYETVSTIALWGFISLGVLIMVWAVVDTVATRVRFRAKLEAIRKVVVEQAQERAASLRNP